MKLSSEESSAIIGKILSPHGVGGLVKVFPYSDFPERITVLECVVLKKDDGQEKEMRIETASVYGRFWLIKFKGIESREQAVTLRESLLTIPREQRVTLPEGSYYHDQLVGLLVCDSDGQLIGTVVDLLATGGHDLLIAEKEREAGRRFMIPAVRKFIRQVDRVAGKIVVDLPEGLLDL